jgi:hypothetical protein
MYMMSTGLGFPAIVHVEKDGVTQYMTAPFRFRPTLREDDGTWQRLHDGDVVYLPPDRRVTVRRDKTGWYTIETRLPTDEWERESFTAAQAAASETRSAPTSPPISGVVVDRRRQRFDALTANTADGNER